uniref:ComS n=1 Tax=Bacillus paralicheniformis (strain ATCC 9945a / NCIMB 11709 / CD-2) TaxID=766760 RepID=D9YRK6_BACP9|nr:ComS [Bacillus paralicheniformis ATCC 9945a]
MKNRRSESWPNFFKEKQKRKPLRLRRLRSVRITRFRPPNGACTSSISSKKQARATMCRRFCFWKAN